MGTLNKEPQQHEVWRLEGELPVTHTDQPTTGRARAPGLRQRRSCALENPGPHRPAAPRGTLSDHGTDVVVAVPDVCGTGRLLHIQHLKVPIEQPVDPRPDPGVPPPGWAATCAHFRKANERARRGLVATQDVASRLSDMVPNEHDVVQIDDTLVIRGSMTS